MEVNYCFGCFEELENGQTICPCCGYDNSVCQNQSLALKEGTILGGRYLIGKVLGQGGFGITYLGFHLINKTKAAIKEYFPQGMCSRYINSPNVAVTKSGPYEKGIAAFETEARMLALFKDNHSIATVNECFYENNTAYIIMDYEDGPSLADEIIRFGRIPWKRVLSLTLPLMEALDRLHQEKVIHRDIKPDNIKIVRDKSGENERLVLLDFGAARSFNSANLTGNYTMILTPGFAPYEQYLQHTHLGPYTDIYSLCATMYMAITGEKPPAATDRMLGNMELKPFSHFHLHVPAYVEHAVFHGMEKKYTDRPQTMNDLYREFSNGGIYSSALDLFSTGTRESLEKALNFFKQIPGYQNSKELAERCTNALSKIYDSERIDSEKERIYQTAVNAMQKGTKDGLTYASHLFGEISGWKNADELEQNSLKKIKDIESERIYREASEKMAEGNVKGLTEALGLFSQIPGWRDADDLAAECKKKLRDLRQKKMLRYIPYLVAVSAGVLFILIGSHTGIPSGKVITVSPTAEAVLPEIPGSADGSFPTLPPVPTGTPADTAVPEAVPTAVTTDTPVPASTENPTETPFPTATPTKTKTPSPTATSTKTETPVPTATATKTKTPSPTATSTKTETPVPTATATKTKTPVPTATATPTKTLTPAEINERIQLLLQGESAFKNGNYSSAFRYMISAADMGDENAQIYVGYMYERGTGTEQSYEKAAEYYRMAADQNNVTALYNLGVFYENGLGVERSYEKAAEYYRMAADQKFAAAENNLGVMYERGSGVEQSYEKAAEYYRRAADQEEPYAQSNLGSLYENGLGVEQSYEKAVELYRLSADQNIPFSQNGLGRCYENGWGVEQSYEKALKYYLLAAGQGLADAQYNIGRLYETGAGVEQSIEKALEYYRLAADQGHEEAQKRINALQKTVSSQL